MVLTLIHLTQVLIFRMSPRIVGKDVLKRWLKDIRIELLLA
jgi:hypothetical protein